MSRLLTSEAFKLSCKELRKRHLGISILEGTYNNVLYWIIGSNCFEVSYDLVLCDEPPYLMLRYFWKNQRIELKVLIEITHPHLGGERYWFLCPINGNRCTVLYLPWGGNYFASRQAYGMAYPDQQLSHVDRSFKKLIRFINW
jgi:hypothetical protein